jgi:hypothetical protein
MFRLHRTPKKNTGVHAGQWHSAGSAAQTKRALHLSHIVLVLCMRQSFVAFNTLKNLIYCAQTLGAVFFLQIFIYRACGTNEIKSAALSSRFWMESS